MIELVLPLRSPSAANLREHWRSRHRRVKHQRSVVRLLWPAAWKGRAWAWPLDVHMTRVGPVPMDDDNVASSLKAIRDQVAAQLGVDDGDRARVRFHVHQERGDYAVRIRIEESSP